MVKRTLVPQLSVTPAPYDIGADVTITATLTHPGGVGPTGWIQFLSGEVPLAPAVAIVNGVAALPIRIWQETAPVTARYLGDQFYGPADGTLTLTAGKPVPLVDLAALGPLAFGSTAELVATVTLPGIAPTGTVRFRTSANATYDVAVAPDGTARLLVCAGFAADCPDGAPLGTADLTITAVYGETAMNLEGSSAPVVYSVTRAPTTTTVTAEPSTVLQGSLVTLRAVVDAPGATADPTGSVSFYGVNPDGSESYLGRDDDLVGGLAVIQTAVGTDLEDLRWPAQAVLARYLPLGAPFEPSNGQTAVTVLRQGLELAIDQPTITPGQPVDVTVRLTHEPGVSDPYTERIVLLVDGTIACQSFVTAPNQYVTCTVPASLLSTGSHDLQATYPGDVVYLPGSSPTLTVGVGKRTPALGASMPFPVIGGAAMTVTWAVFDPDSTGTITVLTPEGDWCTDVPVAQGQCTGTLTTPTPAGQFTEVRVRFSGDDDWNQTEQTVLTRVNLCAALDVSTDTPDLGFVQLETAPNCTIPSSGAPGHLAGTTVTAVAFPNVGIELERWRTLSGSTASTAEGVTWLITNDSTSWVRIATFRVPCFSIAADIVGYGRLAMLPASDCTTPAGAPGWSIGTPVALYPVGILNPGEGEPDAFVQFTRLPTGAAAGDDEFGDYRAVIAINGDIVVGAEFGLHCRVVTVLVNPSSPGDSTEVLTPKNCSTHAVSGHYRGSSVTVTASSGDPTLVLAGWAVDGVLQPTLGRESTATVRVGAVAPTLTAEYVHCYTVTIDLDSVTVRGNDIGRVDLSPPNCPDGSTRYLAGTVVTLTPDVLIDGASFRGWDPTQTTAFPARKGPVKEAVKSITVTADVTVYAGFFTPESCSRIQFLGKDAASILTFPKDGCGPGYYYDLQKEEAARAGITGSEALHDLRYRSTLIAAVPAEVPMDVYVSIKGGDAKDCFGVADPGISSGWQSFGPLTRTLDTCDVGGDLMVWVESCQTISWDLQFMHGGQRYSVAAMPSTMYLKGADGKIGAFTSLGFHWLESAQGTVADGQFFYEELDAGPCASAGNAFPAGRDIGIYPMTPTTGVAFAGWGGIFDDGSLLPSAPMIRTTSEDREMTITAVYDVTCYHLTLGPGIAVEGDAPWCPGYEHEAMMFIAGTAVQLKGDGYRDDDGRELLGFTNDFVHGQTWADELDNRYGFVYMDGDSTVRGDYVTAAQKVGRGVAQGLKFTLGVVAVAAPIFLGMAFPPAGIAFAALGAAAGIMSLLPGDDPSTGFFDLINPTNITQCIAKWSFNNPDQPKDGVNYGAQVATLNNIKNIVTKPDVFIAPVADLRNLPVIGGKLPKSIANLPGGLTFAIGAASFGYGLYDAGIGDADLGPQTIEQLNDTGTMTSCLDEQWRFAGSNLNADPASPAG